MLGTYDFTGSLAASCLVGVPAGFARGGMPLSLPLKLCRTLD